MAKGKAQVNYLGREGLVSHRDTPDYGFIYNSSLTKDAKWNIGDRITLGDGREFRYSKSSSALNTSEACHFTAAGTIAYIAAVDAVAVGETKVTVPDTSTHVAITEDELRGGFIVIFGSVSDGADMMFRGIIGNTASAEDAAVTIYLDGPTDVAIDTSSAYEVYANPWGSLEHTTGSPSAGKAGVPAVYISAADTYFWCQTKGPIFCNPQSTVIDNEGLGVNWRGDGSLDAVATALGGLSIPDVSTTQYAGFRMMGSYAGNGPVIWLVS